MTGTIDTRLNENCACTSLDRSALGKALAAQSGSSVIENLPETHPHLFADTPVYVSAEAIGQMMRTVGTIEGLAATAAYQQRITGRVGAIALPAHGPKGAFMGYDFHLGAYGPQLIEINTNAGGAFLNAVACEAQRVCCTAMADVSKIACPDDLPGQIADMFRTEWHLQRGSGTPGLIAIVDDAPEQQYLYPEFLLAQSLLTGLGLPAVIADPSAFTHQNGTLMLDGQVVDLVYNRLVDFDFSEPGHMALRSAYAAGDVVVTPNPHHHAMLADKRNLITLTDPEIWAASGIDQAAVTTLARIPRTRMVSADDADALWAERNSLFFKPISGHGGKGVYRGDKLTKKVWAAIIAGGYVAQERIAPSERIVSSGGTVTRHKLDVRLYTYSGHMLLAAARLYQGQTTNFRTPGGGFAPIMVVRDAALSAESPR